MHVPISKARVQWYELVSRAEAGEEVILTRYGRPVVVLKSEKHQQEAPA